MIGSFHQKHNEELENQINELTKRIEQKNSETKELQKKLKKFEKQGRGSLTSNTPRNVIGSNSPRRGSATTRSQLSDTNRSRFDTFRNRRSKSPAHYSSSSEDDEIAEEPKTNPLFGIDLSMSLAELMKRRAARLDSNKREDEILTVQADYLRRCNQHLALIVGDYHLRWNKYEEIDVIKSALNKYTCNRKFYKQDSPIIQVLQIIEVELDSRINRFQTARELFDIFSRSQEELFVLLKREEEIQKKQQQQQQ